jgi:flagellar assembly protein FliH
MAEIIRAPRVSEQPRRLDGETGALLGPSAVERSSPPPAASPAPGAAAEAPPPEPAADREAAAERQRFEDALARADERASRAATRIAELERELSDEAEARRQEGYEAGRREGFEESQGEAAASLAAELERLREIAGAAEERLRERLEDRVEDAVVEVVCAAVAKIVGEAAADPDHVGAIVARLLQEVERSEAVAVHVHPDDYRLLVRANGGESWELGSTDLSFVADERVRCGGCLIKTPAGDLDGRLETQLRRFQSLMLETRRQQRAAGEGDAP